METEVKVKRNSLKSKDEYTVPMPFLSGQAHSINWVFHWRLSQSHDESKRLPLSGVTLSVNIPQYEKEMTRAMGEKV